MLLRECASKCVLESPPYFFFQVPDPDRKMTCELCVQTNQSHQPLCNNVGVIHCYSLKTSEEGINGVHNQSLPCTQWHARVRGVRGPGLHRPPHFRPSEVHRQQGNLFYKLQEKCSLLVLFFHSRCNVLITHKKLV